LHADVKVNVNGGDPVHVHVKDHDHVNVNVYVYVKHEPDYVCRMRRSVTIDRASPHDAISINDEHDRRYGSRWHRSIAIIFFIAFRAFDRSLLRNKRSRGRLRLPKQ
jgi:hypothetical protein